MNRENLSEAELALERFIIEQGKAIFRVGNVSDIAARFNVWFGTSSFVVLQLWKRLIVKGLRPGTQVTHLLWALIFLKSYVNESLMSSLTGADRKTVRKWLWYMLEKMAELRFDVVRTKLLFFFN